MFYLFYIQNPKLYHLKGFDNQIVRFSDNRDLQKELMDVFKFIAQ